MIGTSVKTWLDNNNEIAYIDVDVRDGSEALREIRLKTGTKVKVDPLNPAKKKHRDREGEFVGVSYDEKGHLEAAKIKFDDTKRVGKVEFEDLIAN